MEGITGDTDDEEELRIHLIHLLYSKKFLKVSNQPSRFSIFFSNAVVMYALGIKWLVKFSTCVSCSCIQFCSMSDVFSSKWFQFEILNIIYHTIF